MQCILNIVESNQFYWLLAFWLTNIISELQNTEIFISVILIYFHITSNIKPTTNWKAGKVQAMYQLNKICRFAYMRLMLSSVVYNDDIVFPYMCLLNHKWILHKNVWTLNAHSYLKKLFVNGKLITLLEIRSIIISLWMCLEVRKKK